MRNFRQKLAKIIRQEKLEYIQHRNNKSFTEFKWIYYLFQIQHDKKEALTDAELLDYVITFLVDGVSTVSRSITMMLYFLAMYPDYKKRMENEMTKVYEDKDVTFDVLNSLQFTDAFIKETFRYVTPVAGLIFRDAIQDHTLAGFKVKKGTIVTSTMAAIHFNPKYHDNPEKFSVDRWLDIGSKSMNADELSWMPFSSGPRECLGKQLGLVIVELKIVLAEFIRNFDFTLVEGYRAKMGLRFLYEPVDPVRMVLTVRNRTEIKDL